MSALDFLIAGFHAGLMVLGFVGVIVVASALLWGIGVAILWLSMPRKD